MRAVLFDLDGTLLPMDEREFTNGYFGELAKTLAPYGAEPKRLVASVWAGVREMVKNDGTRVNEDVFWASFFENMGGVDQNVFRSVCDRFYSNEFHAARAYTKENPSAKRAVAAAHEKADKVILATNPIFPMSGQLTRLSWIGLDEGDFDLITSYETESCSKPNTKYYMSILERENLSPEDCLMIGNDEREDMLAASQCGMDCFLVTDCMIPCPEHPWIGRRGTFEEMVKMLEEM